MAPLPIAPAAETSGMAAPSSAKTQPQPVAIERSAAPVTEPMPLRPEAPAPLSVPAAPPLTALIALGGSLTPGARGPEQPREAAPVSAQSGPASQPEVAAPPAEARTAVIMYPGAAPPVPSAPPNPPPRMPSVPAAPPPPAIVPPMEPPARVLPRQGSPAPTRALDAVSWPMPTPRAPVPVTPAAPLTQLPAVQRGSAFPSAAPPAPERQPRAAGGDVFLDGARLGSWIGERLAREAGRPQSGPVAFDPRMSPAWPGSAIGV